MMTMDRRYCCRTVLAEPHEQDCPTAAVWSAPALAASEAIDRWTREERESALRFLAGIDPALIVEAAGFLAARQVGR
jgi:hypothetical protein